MTAVRYAPLPDPFRMTRGGELRHAQVAYECWGTLNRERSNAIPVSYTHLDVYKRQQSGRTP